MDHARTELSSLINESKQTRGQLDNAKNDLANLLNTSKKVTLELEKAKRMLQTIEQDFVSTKEKVFGHGMSRASWSNPLERSIQELQRKVDQIQQQLKDAQRNW